MGASIFEGAGRRSPRIQGHLSQVGSEAFEQARQELATLVGWPVSSVSDGATAEYLSRGRVASRKYLKDAGKLA